MSDPILEILSVFSIAILPQVLTAFYPHEMRLLLGRLPGYWKFVSTLPGRIGVIVLILYIASSRLDAFHAIGLNLYEAASPLTLLVAVFLTVYLCLIFVLSRWRSKKMKIEIVEQQQRTLAALRYLDATSFGKRLVAFMDLWLAVIGEELVYRGYLILMLGRQTGSFVPWIVVSLALSVLVHLYQGRTWKIGLTHLIFAGLFILAVIITKSLFAAIIPHLIYNTVWLMRAQRSTSTADAPLEEMKSNEIG